MGDLLTDKVAVITGAGQGIGRECALLMAQEGAKVVVNDLGCTLNGVGNDVHVADGVVDEIRAKGGQAVPNYDSVAEFASAERIINTAVDNFGKIDILVTCAGVLRDRMVFNMSESDWDVVVKTHLYGTFNCVRHAGALFRKQRSGRIVCMASGSGLGAPGQANYSAAKEGIVGFVRTVARDLGKYNVTINALYPRAYTRLTLQPGLQDQISKTEAAGLKRPGLSEWSDRSPENMRVEDIAPLVVYLSSDENTNINGCVLGVSTGRVALYSLPTEVKSLYKKGGWTVDELREMMPRTIGAGVVNPAPAEQPVPAK